MARTSLVYIGIKNTVIAFDRRSGVEAWRVTLPIKYKSSASLVNIVRDAEGLFVSSAGELFSLDPRSGNILWHEPLKGLGTWLTTIATDLGGNSQSLVAMQQQLQAQAAAAATAAS
jgi:outer membrane protein assembly factor BamB